MADLNEPYEIRDPVHGFVRLSPLEWDVINQPAFQRLRRIRQLTWTDLIYPGAMHTRHEHSIGVMHVASRLFDGIVRRSRDVLASQDYQLRDDGIGRQRRIIRLAGLLHDVGHGPFSHAAEEVFPLKPGSSKRYVHEDYSAAIIRQNFADVIDSHPEARGVGIKADDVLGVFSTPASSGSLVWKDLVSGQMDADRMDYLLRDAHHAGVQYGRYDLDRVSHTIRLCGDPNDYGHHIGVEEDGIHAVAGLLIARYMMFTQLYFHKTRAIFDYHLEEALKHILSNFGGAFPTPEAVAEYLKWDDWRVLGFISEDRAGDHGKVLRDRTHFRKVFGTSEVMTANETDLIEKIETELRPYGGVLRDASKSWYKAGPDEIKVWQSSGGKPKTVPLAVLSPVVAGLREVNQRRLYVPLTNRDKAERVVAKITGELDGK